MKYNALVPVKALNQVKSRLATHFSQHQREMLVLDMLQHVLHTLSDSELFEQIYVVSPDRRVQELILDWDAEPLPEMLPGHNPALQAAALTIIERTAWRHGAYSAWTSLRQRNGLHGQRPDDTSHFLQDVALLTISADLPLITKADVHAMTSLAEHYQVTLASSNDGTGTNAILMRPPLALPYLFGPQSLPTYVQTARDLKLTYTVLSNAHLGFDIDTFEDTQKLEQSTYQWSSLSSLAS